MKKDKKPFTDFIISWNLRFKFDRLWRKKYNIPFGSELHRNINQIDIYIDLMEDKFFDKIQSDNIERAKKAEEYNKGNFISEQVLSEEEEDKILNKAKFY